MARVLIEVDPTRPVEEQRDRLQNRWHPDIPAVVSVRPGEVFIVECPDWTGGQVRNDDSATDIRDMELSQPPPHRSHRVAGAEPGDLLVVDILDIGPHPKQKWGYTGIFCKTTAAGSSPITSPTPTRPSGSSTASGPRSRHVPGVRIPYLAHPASSARPLPTSCWPAGMSGSAGSSSQNPERVPPLALPPEPRNAVLSSLRPGTPEYERVAREAARTIPPRENGGNRDIKNLTRGSRALLPVHVKGAKLRWGTCTSARATGRSPSAAPSRCRARSPCAST